MSAPAADRRRRRVLVAALAFVGSAGSLALVADLARWQALALLAVAGLFAGGEAWAQQVDDCVDDADPLCLPSALSLLGVLLLAAHDAGGRAVPSAFCAVGLALMIGGAALRVQAVAALGRHFVSQARAHGEATRVRRGPYALMRHPSEVGLIALALGAAMLAGSGAALCLGLAVLLPLSLWRMRREERATFGALRSGS